MNSLEVGHGMNASCSIWTEGWGDKNKTSTLKRRVNGCCPSKAEFREYELIF